MKAADKILNILMNEGTKKKRVTFNNYNIRKILEDIMLSYIRNLKYIVLGDVDLSSSSQ